MWKITLLHHAEKQLAKLPKKQQRIIGDSIDRMEKDPFQGDVRTLQGTPVSQPLYRKAVGTHRIIFSTEPSKHAVFIQQILKRTKNTYR